MINEIANKLDSLRKEFPFLKKSTDDYVLNALCTQTMYYKNPSNPLDENTLQDIIVDGKNDCGIDCILNDTDAAKDSKDLVLLQCKNHSSFPLEKVKDAIRKLVFAYFNLDSNKTSEFKNDLVQRYFVCKDEMEDDSKVKLVLCVNAPRNGIKKATIDNYFKTLLEDKPNVQLEVYFEKELAEKVLEYDSLRRTVNNGKIKIDKSSNALEYYEEGDDDYEPDAIIINGSASSIKELYSRHHLALFSQNLRYFVKSKAIDEDIKRTISEYRKKFWYKNNGITIICDDFEINGNEIHLSEFSIINGGQTTTLLGKNDSINEYNDFYLPIKVIRAQGETDEEKQDFIYSIAIATNSQKAIKPSDLKANNPEQILFGNELRKNEIYYRTKRGELNPTGYTERYKNLDLPKAAKLGLAGIFLMPGSSRSNSKIMYANEENYYDEMFKRNREKTAIDIKDLLYIDTYFDTKFRKIYAKNTKQMKRITFANLSRTLCLAFCGFLSKYLNNELSEADIKYICNFDDKDEDEIKKVKKILSDASKMNGIFNKNAYSNLDMLESNLYKIFSFLCKQGASVYSSSSSENTIDESGWLKKDSSFYKILSNIFDDLQEEIENNPGVYNIFKKEK